MCRAGDGIYTPARMPAEESHAWRLNEGSGAWCVRETPASAGPKPRLLESVRIALRLRHYSVRTERAYVAWIRRYVLLHGKRHPG